ncbi:MAG: pyrophosphatase [Bdellovibrionota bacterium]
MNIDNLIQSVESISKVYAMKHGIERSSDWFLLKLQEELGELTQAHLKVSGRARKKDLSDSEIKAALAAEAADVLCHVLLYAMHHNIDLNKAVEKKWLAWLEK